MTQKTQSPDDTIPVVEQPVPAAQTAGAMFRLTPWMVPPIVVPVAIAVALAIMILSGAKL